MTRFEISHDFAVALIEKHGAVNAAARTIADQCVGDKGNRVDWQTVEKWLVAARDRKIPAHVYEAANADRLNRVAKLLDESNIPLESIDAIESVTFNSWGVAAKDKTTQKIVTKDLYSTKLKLIPSAKYPEYPLIQPATPSVIRHERRAPLKRSLEFVVVYPDQQFGFRRVLDDFSKMTPMHDDAALDVALQITADVRPNRVVDIGDVLDETEHSRWPQKKEFVHTTQASIYRAAAYYDDRAAAAGPQLEEQDVCGGNHDERWASYMEEHARASFHVRPADATPTSWPPFTMPWALGFEKRGIRYHRYPGSEVWLVKPDLVKMIPGLLCTHAKPGRDDYFASVINGHDHTIESETRTIRIKGGNVAMTRWSSGCLCRVDDQTDRNSSQRIHVASDRGYVKKWKQGLVVVAIDRATKQFQVDQIHFERIGKSVRAIYNGKLYSAPASLRRKVA